LAAGSHILVYVIVPVPFPMLRRPLYLAVINYHWACIIIHRKCSNGRAQYNKGRLKVVFQTISMLTINEIVKEQMIQTISKEDSEVVW